MVIKEFYRIREDGVNLNRVYSNNGFYLQQVETGIIYDEAIDIEDVNYTYIETDTPIEDQIATEDDYLQALDVLGVSEND